MGSVVAVKKGRQTVISVYERLQSGLMLYSRPIGYVIALDKRSAALSWWANAANPMYVIYMSIASGCNDLRDVHAPE